MASTTNLRSRRSEAQLQALLAVERDIRVHDSQHGRKYLRDFRQAFRTYDSPIDFRQVTSRVADSDVVLIGDYHALPAAQRFASTLLEQRAQFADRPVVLGVETIFSRDQHIVEEWWRREIDETELRRRIRFDLDWGYDWTAFYELLVTAREHAHAIYGLDCMAREDLRKISARDRHAAHKIAEIRQSHPRAVILVLFGESHLAPGHLPRVLSQTLPSERVFTILQNVDPLYWQAAGEQQQVEAVQLKKDVVCIFNSTPLEKYESYRLHLSRWSRSHDGDGPDLVPTIYNLIDTLIRFLDIDRYSSRNGTQPKFLVDLMPEVYSGNSEGHLSELLTRRTAKKNEIACVLRRVEERGCAYLAQLNAFYVQNFQMMYVAEEAARFLHHACRGLPVLRERRKLKRSEIFYVRALENALAYFGSRVLCPSREPVPGGAHTSTLIAPESLNIRSDNVQSGAELIGYMLGSRLYDRYLQNRIARRLLRNIFLAHLDQEGKAKEIFSELAEHRSASRKNGHALPQVLVY
jgi:Haem-binding uptake, Tiki superfamily, ChaN